MIEAAPALAAARVRPAAASVPPAPRAPAPLVVEPQLAVSSEVVLRLSGELDLATAPLLAARLLSALAGGPDRVVLELDGLEFVDAAGARPIEDAEQALRRSGGELVLRHPRPSCHRVLELLGLHERCRIEPALPALSRAALRRSGGSRR